MGKELWLVVDGAYAKRPSVKPATALGLVVFSRLRKDALLLSLPPSKRHLGQRGPLPAYGKERIDLAKRAALERGWQQVACVQYGERLVKTIKTFEAILMDGIDCSKGQRNWRYHRLATATS